MFGKRPRRFAVAAVFAFAAFGFGIAQAAETQPPPSQDWTFNGIFGSFDRASLQRGYQVYAEVCESCHSLNLVSYRNLAEIGFNEEAVKATAAEYEVEDGPDDDGEMYMRPALPFDRMAPPFPNEQAARAANSGALPPDLSIIVKARKGGADYVYALLTGFQDEPPEGVEVREGQFYNEYFPGHQIAMAPMIWGGLVEFEDGTQSTKEQIAKDLTAFLVWTAMPELETRKRYGIFVMLFMIVLTGMLYALKRKIWADVH